MQEISFAFNRPTSFLLGYGVILACLLFPVLKILQMRAMADSLKALLVSRQGVRYVLIVLFGVGMLAWVSFETHAGFWALRILDAQHASLDYWYPRSDRLVSPRDIRALRLITTRYDFKEDVVHQRWTIALTTRDGEEYTSINILEEDKAQQAIAALERWSGHTHAHYLRQGMFGSLQRHEP